MKVTIILEVDEVSRMAHRNPNALFLRSVYLTEGEARELYAQALSLGVRYVGDPDAPEAQNATAGFRTPHNCLIPVQLHHPPVRIGEVVREVRARQRPGRVGFFWDVLGRVGFGCRK